MDLPTRKVSAIFFSVRFPAYFTLVYFSDRINIALMYIGQSEFVKILPFMRAFYFPRYAAFCAILHWAIELAPYVSAFNNSCFVAFFAVLDSVFVYEGIYVFAEKHIFYP